MNTYLACLSTHHDIVSLAPLVHALRTRGHTVHVLHHGPPEGRIDALYGFFDLSPSARLVPLQQAPRLSQQIAELMSRLDTHLQQLAPDALLVQGSSSCALAATLAASFQDIPVAHLDAGVRAPDEPSFPEDVNSRLIDQIGRWHFAATAEARQNLLGEGIPAHRIHETGHLMTDATVWARQRMADASPQHLLPPDLLRFLRLHEQRPLLLVSAQHRAHWGQPIQRVAAAVAGLLQMHPQLTVVWPLPDSPQLRADVEMGLAWLPADVRPRLCLTGPLPFPALIAALQACRFAMTDSHRLQLEAPALHKPLLLLREDGPGQRLVDAGCAMLAGTLARQIIEVATELLCDPLLLTALQLPSSPFGDGLAAQRMADILSNETESRKWPERWAA